MSDKKEYIERGALKAHYSWLPKDATLTPKDFDDIIDAQPAADVEPVVRGEWKWEPPYTICSVCGIHSINRFQSKYCQHCGAKMNNPRGAHMERSGSGE